MKPEDGAGCQWVTGQIKRGKDILHTFCNKIVAEGSYLCPKHILFLRDLEQQPQRIKQRAAATTAYRKQQLEVLAASPLRAENPDYDKRLDKHLNRLNGIEREHSI
jgi:hypothetical protein